MPSAEWRARYPADWEAISLRVRKRDDFACRLCKVREGDVLRVERSGLWRRPDADAGLSLERIRAQGGRIRLVSSAERAGWRDVRGAVTNAPAGAIARLTRVVTQAAHLDGDPSSGDERRIVALCQFCHLRRDRDAALEELRRQVLRDQLPLSL